MEPTQRAKQVLDILAYELKDVSIETQALIQLVVEGLIKDAVKEALKPFKLPPPSNTQESLKFRRHRS